MLVSTPHSLFADHHHHHHHHHHHLIIIIIIIIIAMQCQCDAMKSNAMQCSLCNGIIYDILYYMRFVYSCIYLEIVHRYIFADMGRFQHTLTFLGYVSKLTTRWSMT